MPQENRARYNIRGSDEQPLKVTEVRVTGEDGRATEQDWVRAWAEHHQVTYDEAYSLIVLGNPVVTIR